MEPGRVPVRRSGQLVELRTGQRPHSFQVRAQMLVKVRGKVKREESFERFVGTVKIRPATVGNRARCRKRFLAHQFTRAPDALTMRPHFSWSVRMTRWNYSGEVVQSSNACALSRSRMSGERSACTSAPFSRAVTCFGSPAGATMPNQRSAPASL